jgi:hypothetical protein
MSDNPVINSPVDAPITGETDPGAISDPNMQQVAQRAQDLGKFIRNNFEDTPSRETALRYTQLVVQATWGAPSVSVPEGTEDQT